MDRQHRTMPTDPTLVAAAAAGRLCHASARHSVGPRRAPVELMQLGDESAYAANVLFTPSVATYAALSGYHYRQHVMLPGHPFQKLQKPSCIVRALLETASERLIFIDLDVSSQQSINPFSHRPHRRAQPSLLGWQTLSRSGSS